MNRVNLFTKRLFQNAILAAALAFLWTLAGTAQSAEHDTRPNPQQTEAQRQSTEQNTPLLYKLSVLSDREVQTPEGEQLGRISELVVDKSGQVKYAVLSHGGTLGIGEKMTAVSWDSLQIAEKGEYYVLNANKEQLANAPTFGEENWPVNAQWTPSAASLAGESGISQQTTFAELDKDKNGYLSKDEAESADELNAKFDLVDQNRDERIDRSEFSAFEATRRYHGENQSDDMQ